MPEVYRITELRDGAGPLFALTKRVGVFTSEAEAESAMLEAVAAAKVPPPPEPPPAPIIKAFDADGQPAPVEA